MIAGWLLQYMLQLAAWVSNMLNMHVYSCKLGAIALLQELVGRLHKAQDAAAESSTNAHALLQQRDSILHAYAEQQRQLQAHERLSQQDAMRAHGQHGTFASVAKVRDKCSWSRSVPTRLSKLLRIDVQRSGSL